MTDALQNLDQLFDTALMRTLLGGTLLLFLAGLSFLVTRTIVNKVVRRVAARTKTRWDDALTNRGAFKQAAFLAPALVLYCGLSFFPDFPHILERIILAYVVINLVIVISRVLGAGEDIYQTYSVSVKQPIKGYVQLANLIIYMLGGLLAICTILGIHPGTLLASLGAMMALVILVFRDTILSVIASVQIAAYDLVRRGDWITMSPYGVDGDVIDVSLHTVRVQNFDKTIVTVPTHKLIDDSFKNWRGMSDSGGRRIKRCIFIDQTSIKFLDEAALGRLAEIDRLKPYLARKEEALANDNSDIDAHTGVLNRRELTNVGTFRAYIEAYLRDNSKIHKEGMTFLIRQLAPSPNGLPMEIYVFTNDTNWVHYESIQADIFDHLLAALPAFGLRVFQYPTGYDTILSGGAVAADTDG